MDFGIEKLPKSLQAHVLRPFAFIDVPAGQFGFKNLLVTLVKIGNDGFGFIKLRHKEYGTVGAQLLDSQVGHIFIGGFQPFQKNGAVGFSTTAVRSTKYIIFNFQNHSNRSCRLKFRRAEFNVSLPVAGIVWHARVSDW